MVAIIVQINILAIRMQLRLPGLLSMRRVLRFKEKEIKGDVVVAVESC